MNKENILQIKNLSFSFGKTCVLRSVSINVRAGDFLGLIGPNGSGKTTLIKLILGLYTFHKGSIELLGTNIKTFSKWSKIGYVPQKATHFEDSFPATVKEVVSMGLLSQKCFLRLHHPKDEEAIHEALKTVDMLKFADHRIGELSGGQKQRVFIARAIVSNPSILFLDEPTTGVDQKTQNRFYSLLHKLNLKRITIILVSHDIGRVTKYVSKIASLNQKLEFYGSHEEFCAWDRAHYLRSKPEHKLCLHHN